MLSEMVDIGENFLCSFSICEGLKKCRSSPSHAYIIVQKTIYILLNEITDEFFKIATLENCITEHLACLCSTQYVNVKIRFPEH